MIKIYQDETHNHIIRWTLNPGTTWEHFHTTLSELRARAKQTSEPFTIIATTTGRMPRGNALAHLRRLITIINEFSTIQKFIVVNHKANPVGQAFINLAIKLFAKEGKLQVVKSDEEALAIAVPKPL